MQCRALAVGTALLFGGAALRGAENAPPAGVQYPEISIAKLALSMKSFESTSEREFEDALAESKAVESSKGRMAAVLAGEASLYAASRLRGQERLDYLDQMARNGDAAAASALGDMLDSGDGLATDTERAAGYYHTAALGGRMDAAHNLGAAYAIGRGVQRDFAAALAWLTIAKERGDPSAEDERLRRYLVRLDRHDLLRNAERHVENWRGKQSREKVAAALPTAAALTFLAEDTGAENPPIADGESRKPQRPVEKPQVVVVTILGERLTWPRLADVEQAANRGDVVAMAAMGRLLTNGRLSPRDPLGAVVWLERSAGNGNIDAAHQLGDLYSKGDGIVPDDAKSFAYFMQAAKGGSPLAMANIGVYCTNGRGTERDMVAGLAWLIVAKQFGVDLGREARLRGFLAQHRPADVKKAEELSVTLRREVTTPLR